MIPQAGKLSRKRANGQKGYLLLSVMLLITVMMIALAMELPRISQQIKREKEQELVNRGKEYARAIRKFYRKNGTYPVSLDQLESTNNLRFLRKRFKDPMTESGEWKLVHLGEAQIALPNTPSALGTGTSGTPGQPGQAGTLNTSNPFASTPTPAPSPGGFGAPSGPGGLNPGGAQQGANPPGTSQMGTLTVQGGSAGGGPIVGVASTSKKTSIKEFNGNSEYDQWYFVYDPRLEASAGVGGVAIAGPVGAGGPTGMTIGVGVTQGQGAQGAPGTPPAPGPAPTPGPMASPSP